MAHFVAYEVRTPVVRGRLPPQNDLRVARCGGEALRSGRHRCRRLLGPHLRSGPLSVHRTHLEAVQRAVGQTGDGVRRSEPHRGPRRVAGHTRALGMAHLVAQDGGTAVARRRLPPQNDLRVARCGGEALRSGRQCCRRRLDLRRKTGALSVDRAHLEAVQRVGAQTGDGVRPGEPDRSPRRVAGHARARGKAHLVVQDGGATVGDRCVP